MAKDVKQGVNGLRQSKFAKIITVNNQKGGVGKTTITFHLAKAVAKMGKRALVIDVDTQANISQFLSGDIDIKKLTVGGAGLLLETGTVPESAIRETEHEGVWLLHGHQGLDEWDNNQSVEEMMMGPAIRQTLRALNFDVIIIDTPPAVGVRHLAPLVWADKVVIPMDPEQSAVIGFQDVLASIDAASRLNPGLKWVGVLNRLDKRARSHQRIEEFVRNEYGKSIAPTLTIRTAVADAIQGVPAMPVWAAKNADRDLRELWLDLCTKLVS
ncbi:ParA family protein [Glaciimonas sp. GG7]